MIKSMTGFGLSTLEDDQFIVSVEVKTLNSKFLDLNIRSPKQFSDKEFEIRNLVGKLLDRGKVNLNIEFSHKAQTNLPVLVNEELFLSYYKLFQRLADKAEANAQDIFKLALQSPLVISNNIERKSDDTEWAVLQKVIKEALVHCDQFRKDEGSVLQRKMLENVSAIRKGLNEIKLIDPVRKETVQSRIKSNFGKWLAENEFDQNRLEQELIYYFEKIDITEELVRLETHLDYFEKTINESENQGKKLGFISQEIGREINTIGSKANDAQIQRHVVVMKDELEKIKEQALNIL